MNLVKSAYAAITNPVIGASGTGSGELIVGNIISAVVGVLLIVGFLLTLIHLLLGGLKWISAGGDKNQLETARNQITQAFVGLIILAATWAIMLLLSSFLGLGFPNIKLPSLDPDANYRTPVCAGGGYCASDVGTCAQNGGSPTGASCTLYAGQSGICCNR